MSVYCKNMLQPKQCSSLHSVSQSFIGLWIKLRHHNKSAMFKLNPVQSRRCNLQTVRERVSAQIPIAFRWQWAKVWKESLPWFWIDCIQNLQPNCSKWNSMSESYEKTCIDWTGVNFLFKEFFRNLLLKIIVNCVIDQTFITWSNMTLTPAWLEWRQWEPGPELARYKAPAQSTPSSATLRWGAAQLPQPHCPVPDGGRETGQKWSTCTVCTVDT